MASGKSSNKSSNNKSESSSNKNETSVDQLKAAQNADDTQSSNGDDTGARHDEETSTSSKTPKVGDQVTEKEGVPGGGGLRTGVVTSVGEDGDVSVAFLPASQTVKSDTLDF